MSDLRALNSPIELLAGAVEIEGTEPTPISRFRGVLYSDKEIVWTCSHPRSHRDPQLAQNCAEHEKYLRTPTWRDRLFGRLKS